MVSKGNRENRCAILGCLTKRQAHMVQVRRPAFSAARQTPGPCVESSMASSTRAVNGWVSNLRMVFLFRENFSERNLHFLALVGAGNSPLGGNPESVTNANRVPIAGQWFRLGQTHLQCTCRRAGPNGGSNLSLEKFAHFVQAKQMKAASESKLAFRRDLLLGLSRLDTWHPRQRHVFLFFNWSRGPLLGRV